MASRRTEGFGSWKVARLAVLALIIVAGVVHASEVLAQQAKPTKMTKIRIIDSPQLPWPVGWELIEAADAKGFFKEQGLELVRVPLPPDQYTLAIESGRTDLTGYADYAYFINIFDKGVKVKEIVASSLLIDPEIAGDGVFVLQKSPIKKPQDFLGKTIGMQNPSFSSAWFTYDYLSRHGVTKKDITYLAIHVAQQEQTLVRGDVDGQYVYGPLDAIWRSRPGEFRQVFALSDLTGRRMIRGGTMVLQDFIKKNPDTVRRYVAAIAKTADWANAGNQNEVVKIMVERGKIKPELARWTYRHRGEPDYSNLRWAEHGLQKEEDVKFWLELLERQGIVPTGKYKPSDLYTDEFNPFFRGK